MADRMRAGDRRWANTQPRDRQSGTIPAPPIALKRRHRVPSIQIASPQIDEDESTAFSSWITTFPSWLLSLILHLSFFVALASLVIPKSNCTRLTTLLSGFSTPELPSVVMVLNPSKFDLPQTDIAKPDDSQPSHEEPVEQPTAQPSSPIGEPSDILENGNESDERKPNSDVQESNPETAPETSMSSSTNLAREPQVETQLVDINALITAFGGDSESDEREDEHEKNSHDRIVNRFIAFDLGHLRGKEGRNASQEFAKLGPDAIPALVRGLNKSARYQASCPVGVISNKLARELTRTNDERLVDYAMTHLGKGVNQDMPHARTVFAFRNRLIGSNGGTVARRLAEKFDIQITDETRRQITKMSSLGSEKLGAILSSSDDEDELNAALIALTRRSISDSSNRIEIGMILASVMRNARHAAMPALADAFSRELADGQSFVDQPNMANAWERYWAFKKSRNQTAALINVLNSGKPEKMVPALCATSTVDARMSARLRVQLAEALMLHLESSDTKIVEHAKRLLTSISSKDHGDDQEAWSKYWATYRVKKIEEPLASSRLVSANNLMERGRHDAARRYLAKLVRDFPHTAAAKTAQRKLSAKD